MQTTSRFNDSLQSSFSFQTIAHLQAADLRGSIFFEQYQKPGIPVLISGLLEAEPEWTLDYLCSKLGPLEFPVRHYGRDRYRQDKRQWRSTGSGVEARGMVFQAYAELLRNGEAYAQDLYLARCALTDTPLAESTGLKQAEARLGLKGPATDLNVWVGPGGHISCLHYDPMDGTLMQLYGTKRVILYPPDQLYNVYPFSVLNHLRYGLKLRSVYSQVYPDRPDFESFPKFKTAQQYRSEVLMQPGDILFIPAGWWHEVISLGTEMVCSVNRFWHVLPLSRSFRSWSKWRAHLSSALAMPHVAWNFMTAISSAQRNLELRKLMQKL